jgi:hypothetical protein
MGVQLGYRNWDIGLIEPIGFAQLHQHLTLHRVHHYSRQSLPFVFTVMKKAI